MTTRVTVRDEHSVVRVKTDLAQTYCIMAIANKYIQHFGMRTEVTKSGTSIGADALKAAAWNLISLYSIRKPGNGRACFRKEEKISLNVSISEYSR